MLKSRKPLRRSPCKVCGSIWHTASYHKPKKPLKVESDKARRLRIATYKAWIKQNPPDKNGTWTCYLQISTLCPKILPRSLLTLEHVKARSRHPELKYDITNIRPACGWCNYMKRSRSLEELARIWPHLLKYLDKPLE